MIEFVKAITLYLIEKIVKFINSVNIMTALQREQCSEIWDYFNTICMRHLFCMRNCENKQEHMLRKSCHPIVIHMGLIVIQTHKLKQHPNHTFKSKQQLNQSVNQTPL